MATTELSPHDLPLWMRRARRGLDWGILFVIAFSLAVSWAFILQPGLPRTNASENYVFRASDYAQAIGEGQLYPRWSPNVFGGYGAPIPNFLAPGAAYVPALIQFFFTADPVSAVKIVYVLSIVIAGSATYAFVLRRAGATAGVLASLLYVFSPYLSLQAPHVLGDLPACMSMALLPTLLWSVDRLLSYNRPLDLALVTFVSAGLLLTHPTSAVLGFLIALAYTGFWIAQIHRQARWVAVCVALMLGIGFAAFFWLPALAEQDEIIWQRNGDAPALLLTLRELFSPLRPIDLNELIPTPQLTLGLGLIVFTIAGVVTTFYFRAKVAFQLFFAGVGLILLITALVIFPQETWLLGAISFCFAIASTATLFWQQRLPRLLFPLLLVIAFGLSVTNWFAPRWSETFGSTDALAQVQYEQFGYGVASIPTGAFIPTTLSASLPSNETLVNSFSGDIVRKIGIQTGVQVGVLAHGTHSDRFQIDMQTSGTLHILTAYHPGWNATLNQLPVPVTRDPATGLLNVEIPNATSSELAIAFGMTAPQAAAWIVTIVALLTMLIIATRYFHDQGDAYEELQLLNGREARLGGMVIISFIALILVFATSISPASLTARPGYALDGSMALRSRTEVGLEAISYRLEVTEFRAADRIPLTIYWRALRFLPANYRTELFLINLQTGERTSMGVPRYPGSYPPQRWLTNRYVTDSYTLTIPAELAAGDYALGMVVTNCTANCTSENQLTFFNQDGIALGQTLVLPTALTLKDS